MPQHHLLLPGNVVWQVPQGFLQIKGLGCPEPADSLPVAQNVMLRAGSPYLSFLTQMADLESNDAEPNYGQRSWISAWDHVRKSGTHQEGTAQNGVRPVAISGPQSGKGSCCRLRYKKRNFTLYWMAQTKPTNYGHFVLLQVQCNLDF
jgi:hypothetical protein